MIWGARPSALRSSLESALVSQPAKTVEQPIAGSSPLPSLDVAPMAVAGLAPPVGMAPVIDQSWLDARIGEMTVRVEQSLAKLNPEATMDTLNQRFDALDKSRFDLALQDVATHSDVEGLRLVEASHNRADGTAEFVQSQLSRLDAIDDQLRSLNKKLGDDEIVRLFGGLVPTESDLSRFAEQAAEKVAHRFAAQLAPTAAVSSPALAADHLASSDQLAAMHDLLAGFVDERRRTDAQTADALDTMQHAMQHVLDRVDALDQGAVPAGSQQGFVEERAGPPFETPNDRPVTQMDRDVVDRAPLQPRSFAEEAKAAARAAAATERATAPVPQTDVSRRVEPEFNRSTRSATAAYQPPAASEAEPSTDRRAFIALARQAADRAKFDNQLATPLSRQAEGRNRQGSRSAFLVVERKLAPINRRQRVACVQASWWWPVSLPS